MRLTRKKAIELCIELWEWLAKTGKPKDEWPDWEKYGRDIANDCWFCEYTARQNNGYICGFGGDDICPYHKKYGHCNHTGSFYNLWEHVKTPHTRKKYAKLFLEQIKSIKQGR